MTSSRVLTGISALIMLGCSSSTPMIDAVDRNVADFGAPSNSCAYRDLCPDGRTAEWGQLRVNGDLMLKFLEDNKIPARTKVAVVDSGFDVGKNRANIGSPSFQSFKGTPEVGDETKDESGHGTAVAGLVGGKSPIGLAPNLPLTFYRAMKKNGGGSTTTGILDGSIEKACADGHDVINMSWGNSIDEFDIDAAEKSDKEFHEKLLERGCLLVVAAGNDSVRIERKSLNIDDNYLRAEASAPSGERAYFSSNGEVIAPGQGVFTLLSRDDPDPVPTEKTCGKRDGQFINGTSFASPITAAIAAQVMNVFKAAPRYQLLPPADRIRMVTRTLVASQKVLGHLDGYLAVRIAHAWGRSRLGVATPDELFALLKPERDATCGNPTRSPCKGITDCGKKRRCVDEARLRLSLCGAADRSDLVADLLVTTYEMGAFEMSLQAMRVAAAQGAKNEALRKKLARRSWQFQIQSWVRPSSIDKRTGKPYEGIIASTMKFDTALALLPHLLTRGYTGDSSDADQALRDFLASSALRARLSANERKGAKEDLELVRNLLQRAIEGLGSEEALRIFRSASQLVLKAIPDSSTDGYQEVLSWLRLLERLEKDPAFRTWHSDFPPLTNALAQAFEGRQPRLILPNRAGFDHLRPYLERYSSSYARLKDQILKGRVGDLEDMTSFAALTILYDRTLAPDTRLKALLAAVDTVAPALIKDPKALARLQVLGIYGDLALEVITASIEKDKASPALVEEATLFWWSIGRSRHPSLAIRLRLFLAPFAWNLRSAFEKKDAEGNAKPVLAEEAEKLVVELTKLDGKARRDLTSDMLLLLERFDEDIAKRPNGVVNLLALFEFVMQDWLALKDGDNDFVDSYYSSKYSRAVVSLLRKEKLMAQLKADASARALLVKFRQAVEEGRVAGLKRTSSTKVQILDFLEGL